MSHTLDESDVPLLMGIDLLSEARRQLGDGATTIRHCLTQLDDVEVWWRPQARMNSVGNLVLHFTGNLRQRFLSDIGGEPFDRDRFGEFTERRTIPRDELVERIDDVVRRVDALLSACRPNRLARRCPYVVTAGTMDGTVQASSCARSCTSPGTRRRLSS